MKTVTMAEILKILSLALGVLFLIIGMLNLFLVHPIPGIFYVILSFIYLPQTSTILQKKIGFSVPLVVQLILGFLILWGTLAVTDLAEILGF